MKTNTINLIVALSITALSMLMVVLSFVVTFHCTYAMFLTFFFGVCLGISLIYLYDVIVTITTKNNNVYIIDSTIDHDKYLTTNLLNFVVHKEVVEEASQQDDTTVTEEQKNPDVISYLEQDNAYWVFTRT